MFNSDTICNIDKFYFSFITFGIAYIIAIVYSYIVQKRQEKMKIDDDYDPDEILRDPDEMFDDNNDLNFDFGDDDLGLLTLNDDEN